MRIFEDLNVAWGAQTRKANYVSATLLVISAVSLFTAGLELGIDFKGGREFVVETTEPLSANAVRADIGTAIGAEPEVKAYGENGLLIRTTESGDDDALKNAIVATLESSYGQFNPTITKEDNVGPRFARDLKRGAIYSVIGSLFVIFLYIMIRFEWRYGVGAVVALFHDVLIVLGMFALLDRVLPFSLQIDQTIIAAFLTLVGYGLNDTVVIFDRIREYATLFKTQPFDETVDRSINRTMSRTIVTSGTTLLVVIVLFIFGGEVLKGFSFALILGIVVGTYSSIFVASPVVVELRRRFPVR